MACSGSEWPQIKTVKQLIFSHFGLKTHTYPSVYCTWMCLKVQWVKTKADSLGEMDTMVHSWDLIVLLRLIPLKAHQPTQPAWSITVFIHPACKNIVTDRKLLQSAHNVWVRMPVTEQCVCTEALEIKNIWYNIMLPFANFEAWCWECVCLNI